MNQTQIPNARELATRLERIPKSPERLLEPPPLPAGARIRTPSGLNRLDRRGLFAPLLAAPGGPQPGASARQAGNGAPDTVLELVHRITQGFSLAEYQRAKRLGYHAYLEEQLDHLSIDDSDMDARLANFPTLTQSPKELVDAYSFDPAIPQLELKGAMVVRAVHSKRQLFERMCEFWTDHFNINHNKDPEWAFKNEDDREVIRKYALATFPELLSASAHSGAMMYYLDNWLNIVGTAQENYARELMELHTLGVNGGYTETDVKEVAKVLTGWSLNLNSSSPNYLRFQFVRAWHQTGTKTVLGQTIPPFSYQQGGEQVLAILSSHPSTARHIATKMTKWLLTENPPQEIIDDVTATYLATGGDIKAMIRAILREEYLAQVPSAIAPKFRRPFHYIASLLRGLEAEVYDPNALLYFLSIMGHLPFDWHAPNGYPDSVNAWGRSLLPRWSFASFLLLNYIPGVQVSLGKILALLGGFGAKGLAKRIDTRILGRALSPAERKRVQAFLDARAPLIWPEVYEAIGLAASAPSYQWA